MRSPCATCASGSRNAPRDQLPGYIGPTSEALNAIAEQAGHWIVNPQKRPSSKHVNDLERGILAQLVTILNTKYEMYGEGWGISANLAHAIGHQDAEYQQVLGIARRGGCWDIYGDFLAGAPVLLIVSPTTNADYCGFCIPVLTEPEKRFPGAPTAYLERRPAPLLDEDGQLVSWPNGIPEGARDRLQNYINGREFKHCVSIPIYGTGTNCLGVLNLNSVRPLVNNNSQESMNQLRSLCGIHLETLRWLESLRLSVGAPPFLPA